MPSDVVHFAETVGRKTGIKFGLRERDRLTHMYLIGKTGVGKSTVIETLARSDIATGRGFALVDPHGDMAARLTTYAQARRQDVTVIDISDPDVRFGYNPLIHVSAPLRPLLAGGVLDVLKKMWPDAWGVRMEHILRNVLLALLDQPSADFGDILRMLSDKDFRKAAQQNIENEQVSSFWTYEFPKYSYRYAADAMAPIQNKVGAFLADPRLARFFTRADGSIRLRKIMDTSGVLIINLAKGRLGEDSAHLLGGLMVSAIGLAAYSRADIPESARQPFLLYLDEFQNVTTLAAVNMLSELRKFRLGMILANQHLSQLDPKVRDGVLGNAGTLGVFRISAADAAYFTRELEPFTASDLVELPNHEFYIRLMVDGSPTRPFSARTLSPTW